MIPHIINADGAISVVIDGKMEVVSKEHVNYNKVLKAIKNDKIKKLKKLINIAEAVKEKVKHIGNIKIENDTVYYKDKAVHNTLTKRMLEMISENIDIMHLAKFLDNLMQNPSYRAVNELYDFLEAGNIPITDRGTFLVYKKIRSDWKDIYTGTIDNSIGAIVEVNRNEVDEDSEKTCSYGLHVCSYDYLPHFGAGEWDRVIICEVNPKDVVAIPKDYDNTKMRVCKYVVIDEVKDYNENDILSKKKVVELEDKGNESYWDEEHDYGIDDEYIYNEDGYEEDYYDCYDDEEYEDEEDYIDDEEVKELNDSNFDSKYEIKNIVQCVQCVGEILNKIEGNDRFDVCATIKKMLENRGEIDEYDVIDSVFDVYVGNGVDIYEIITVEEALEDLNVFDKIEINDYIIKDLNKLLKFYSNQKHIDEDWLIQSSIAKRNKMISESPIC